MGRSVISFKEAFNLAGLDGILYKLGAYSNIPPRLILKPKVHPKPIVYIGSGSENEFLKSIVLFDEKGNTAGGDLVSILHNSGFVGYLDQAVRVYSKPPTEGIAKWVRFSEAEKFYLERLLKYAASSSWEKVQSLLKDIKDVRARFQQPAKPQYDPRQIQFAF